jgi:ribose transport system ATP-binding protein
MKYENGQVALLTLRHISKSFGEVHVLKGVNFEIQPGEVHALMGENGAGKSTLMKIVSGVYQPDKGTISVNGETTSMTNPNDAIEKGIALIHQEISLVPGLSVAENIFLGNMPRKSNKMIDWKKMKQDARCILDDLQCDFSENTPVGQLNIARQQMVEIAKALAKNPNIVIFDEPTAALTDKEKDILFDKINMLKKRGVGMVYISHRMDEIFTITDRVSVLRDGVKTGTFLTKETNPKELTKMMVGREVVNQMDFERSKGGADVLKVEGLTSFDTFKDISFSIKEGEVVGLYGLVGAGRTEIAETIFGVRKKTAGSIDISGEQVSIKNAKTAMKNGVAFVTEDRKKQGLVLGLPGDFNMSLAKLDKIHNFGFVKTKEEQSIFKNYYDSMSIKIAGPKQIVGELSGGNQQKIILGKWLTMNPKLLILDEPTRGIDVAAKAEIHQLIREEAAKGMAVLVISSEMPEIMGLCDRIMTICEGEITAEYSHEEVTEKLLLHGAMAKTLKDAEKVTA